MPFPMTLVAAGTIKDSLGRDWDPLKHPRGRDGRFIRVFKLVHMFFNSQSATPWATGRVVGVNSNGSVRTEVTAVADASHQDYIGHQVDLSPDWVESLNEKATLNVDAVKPSSKYKFNSWKMKSFFENAGLTNPELEVDDWGMASVAIGYLNNGEQDKVTPTVRYHLALYARSVSGDGKEHSTNDYMDLLEEFGVPPEVIDDTPDGLSGLAWLGDKVNEGREPNGELDSVTYFDERPPFEKNVLRAAQLKDSDIQIVWMNDGTQAIVYPDKTTKLHDKNKGSIYQAAHQAHAEHGVTPAEGPDVNPPDMTPEGDGVVNVNPTAHSPVQPGWKPVDKSNWLGTGIDHNLTNQGYDHDEKLALFSYLDASYQLATHLRGGHELTPEAQKMVDDIDSALEKKQTANPGEYYRGIVLYNAELRDEFVKMYQPGAVFKDNAFLSTSHTYQTAFEFVKPDYYYEDPAKAEPVGIFTLQVPAGVNYVDLTANAEDEILFGRGINWKVDSVSVDDNGDVHIGATYVGDAKSTNPNADGNTGAEGPETPDGVDAGPDPDSGASPTEGDPLDSLESATAGPKFEILPDPGTSGDGYWPGTNLWGKFGAAGVMLRHVDDDGTERFLMVQRGPIVSSNKGKWQLPGGALNSNENDYQGTARELWEELQTPDGYLDKITPAGEVKFDHESGWHYTNIAADVPEQFDPTVDGTETGDAGWFTKEEILELPLHPALADNLNAIFSKYDNADATVQPTPESDDDSTGTPLGTVLDATNWEQVGGQGGSNTGGLFKDPDGNQYYVKKQKSASHASNEATAAAFYEEAGISSAPQILATTKWGPHGTASPWMENTKDFASKRHDPEYLEKMYDGFVVDAWLANWDVAGLSFDNVVSDKDGNPLRVDPGGALLFRAQGAPKGGAFGDEVGELQTFKNTGNNAGKVFQHIPYSKELESAKRVMDITPDKIDEIVAALWGDDSEEGKKLATTLKNRRKFIADHYGLSLPEDEVVPDPIPEELTDEEVAEEFKPLLDAWNDFPESDDDDGPENVSRHNTITWMDDVDAQFLTNIGSNYEGVTIGDETIETHITEWLDNYYSMGASDDDMQAGLNDLLDIAATADAQNDDPWSSDAHPDLSTISTQIKMWVDVKKADTHTTPGGNFDPDKQYILEFNHNLTALDYAYAMDEMLEQFDLKVVDTDVEPPDSSVGFSGYAVSYIAGNGAGLKGFFDELDKKEWASDDKDFYDKLESNDDEESAPSVEDAPEPEPTPAVPDLPGPDSENWAGMVDDDGQYRWAKDGTKLRIGDKVVGADGKNFTIQKFESNNKGVVVVDEAGKKYARHRLKLTKVADEPEPEPTPEPEPDQQDLEAPLEEQIDDLKVNFGSEYIEYWNSSLETALDDIHNQYMQGDMPSEIAANHLAEMYHEVGNLPEPNEDLAGMLWSLSNAYNASPDITPSLDDDDTEVYTGLSPLADEELTDVVKNHGNTSVGGVLVKDRIQTIVDDYQHHEYTDALIEQLETYSSYLHGQDKKQIADGIDKAIASIKSTIGYDDDDSANIPVIEDVDQELADWEKELLGISDQDPDFKPYPKSVLWSSQGEFEQSVASYVMNEFNIGTSIDIPDAGMSFGLELDPSGKEVYVLRRKSDSAIMHTVDYAGVPNQNAANSMALDVWTAINTYSLEKYDTESGNSSSSLDSVLDSVINNPEPYEKISVAPGFYIEYLPYDDPDAPPAHFALRAEDNDDTYETWSEWAVNENSEAFKQDVADLIAEYGGPAPDSSPSGKSLYAISDTDNPGWAETVVGEFLDDVETGAAADGDYVNLPDGEKLRHDYDGIDDAKFVSIVKPDGSVTMSWWVSDENSEDEPFTDYIKQKWFDVPSKDEPAPAPQVTAADLEKEIPKTIGGVLEQFPTMTAYQAKQYRNASYALGDAANEPAGSPKWSTAVNKAIANLGNAGPQAADMKAKVQSYKDAVLGTPVADAPAPAPSDSDVNAPAVVQKLPAGYADIKPGQTITHLYVPEIGDQPVYAGYSPDNDLTATYYYYNGTAFETNVSKAALDTSEVWAPVGSSLDVSPEPDAPGEFQLPAGYPALKPGDTILAKYTPPDNPGFVVYAGYGAESKGATYYYPNGESIHVETVGPVDTLINDTTTFWEPLDTGNESNAPAVSNGLNIVNNELPPGEGYPPLAEGDWITHAWKDDTYDYGGGGANYVYAAFGANPTGGTFYYPNGTTAPTTASQAYLDGSSGWVKVTQTKTTAPSVPEAAPEPVKTGPSKIGYDGKPMYVGDTVFWSTKSMTGTVVGFEQNDIGVKVKFPDGKTRNLHRKKLKAVNDNTSQPAQTSTPTPTPTPAPSTPIVTYKPKPAIEPDPSSPWFEQPKPDMPLPPPAANINFVSDEWMQKADANYKARMAAQGKTQKDLSASSTYTQYVNVQKNGDLAELDKLLQQTRITQEMHADAKAQILANKAPIEAAQAAHAAEMDKYYQDVKAWKLANGIDDFAFPGAPKNATEEFTGGPADWTKGPVGTPSAANVFDAISTADAALAARGASFAADGDQIEDLDIRAMRVIDSDGAEKIELKFKLTAWAGDALKSSFSSKPGVKVKSLIALKNRETDPATGLPKYSDTNKYQTSGDSWSWIEPESGARIEVTRDDKNTTKQITNALHNQVRVFMPPGSTADDFEKVLTSIGISKAQPSTQEDLRIYAENKLMSVFGGNTDATENRTGAARTALLQQIQTQYGVTINDIRFATTGHGRTRLLLSDEAAEKMKQYSNITGFKHNVYNSHSMDVWKGILGENNPSGVLATHVRWSEGVGKSGMSSSGDMAGGGGDYVFTRPMHDNPTTASSSGSVVMHPDAAMHRLDHYSNQSDNGTGKHYDGRKSYDIMKGSPYEVQWKHGIPLQEIWYVVMPNSQMRTQILQWLKDRGIDEINGVPVEQFVLTSGMAVPNIDPSVFSTAGMPSVMGPTSGPAV